MAVLKYYKDGGWKKVNAPINEGVTSVNGQTGDVVIDTGADIPISNVAPENPEVGDLWLDTTTGVTEEEGYVASFNGRAGEVVPQSGDYTADMVGLGNVDNVQQYSAENPPPYPVTSVNGQTGVVTVNASNLDGILPIANGGTGVTNLSELATAMGANPDLNGRIQVGYYWGTGKSGSSNPNSITFNFVPKYLMITTAKQRSGYYNSSTISVGTNNFFPMSINRSYVVVDNSPTTVTIDSQSAFVDLTDVGSSYSNSTGMGYNRTYNSITTNLYNKIVGTTFSWYFAGGNLSSSQGSGGQFNSSNTKYYYMAIG